MIAKTLLERGLIPDGLIRRGIRRLLRERLRQCDRGSADANRTAEQDWVRELRQSPIAVATELANEQHYEVPAGFYEMVLGKRLKYSSGLWDGDATDLDRAEEAMLATYVERAGVRDGMRVLDLGCGWGSMTLYLAERFPNSQIVGVSNSSTQREFILARAAERGFDNVSIVTCDVNNLQLDQRFDRAFSIEMFEHMRNYEQLMQSIANHLNEDGKLFVHIFVHREFSYPFEDRGRSDWMSRHFFSGGQMPSDQLLLNFQDHMELDTQWRVNGTHYAKTSEAWLERFDANRDAIRALFQETYGRDARRMFVYWRIFFMSCAELWGFQGGDEWFVSHYLFSRRAAIRAAG